MSVINPPIEELLKNCNNDAYLLCSIATKRSRDVLSMQNGQTHRAESTASNVMLSDKSVEEVRRVAGMKPLSIAMEEIAAGDVSYDEMTFYDSMLRHKAIDATEHSAKIEALNAEHAARLPHNPDLIQ